MHLKDVLKIGQAEPVTIEPDTPLLEVARLLRDQGIGVVVVVDNNASIVGILSERDISRAVAGDYEGFGQATARDHMTPEVVVCEVTQDPQTAIWLMAEYGIRHLPITDQGRLLGMVSSRDVLRVMADRPVFDEDARDSVLAV